MECSLCFAAVPGLAARVPPGDAAPQLSFCGGSAPSDGAGICLVNSEKSDLSGRLDLVHFASAQSMTKAAAPLGCCTGSQWVP